MRTLINARARSFVPRAHAYSFVIMFLNMRALFFMMYKGASVRLLLCIFLFARSGRVFVYEYASVNYYSVQGACTF